MRGTRSLPIAALLAIFILGATSAQDDAKKAPGKVEKPVKKTLEDAIARALRKARKIDNQKLLRATVLKGTLADDDSYVVICELGTGDLAIFEGSEEPETDQFFLLEKTNVEALAEIANRASKR